MKKYMIADLIKDSQDIISFTMTASHGKYDGTFGRTHDTNLAGPAEVKGTRIEGTDIYNVIVTFEAPYPGPYEYIMPYDVLTDWEKNSSSGSWYNANIRGNKKYFPKEPTS